MSRSPARDVRLSLSCAAALGGFSAFGDWIWARFVPDGAVLPGIAHGLAIFVILALCLGWAADSRRALRRLLPTLPLAGLLIAAAFYPLAVGMGYLAALLLCWVLMWLTLAVLQRWARASRETLAVALARGALAAILSGLAFWSISGIWTGASVEPVNYAVRFAQWSYAFLPGFLALLVGRTRPLEELEGSGTPPDWSS